MDVKFVDDQGAESRRTMTVKRDGETHPLVNHLPQGGQLDSSSKLKMALVSILVAMAGELVGTFVLTLVICSAVSTAVLSGAQVGIWQVAIVCGLGVATSIYCTAFVSDAHLNPAVTAAFAVVRYRHFSWKKVPLYVTAQMLGGLLAGVVLYAFSSAAIAVYELKNGIERGQNESVITAMMFGFYFPNPALYDHSEPENLKVTSLVTALALETWCTAILAFVIFSVTAKENTSVGGENKIMAPLVIGLTVSVLISIYGPYTQVGINPARDLGPRIVAACAGWGTVAIPGPRGGFWVYLLGPVVGAIIGAALSEHVITRGARLVKRWREQEEY